MDNFEQFFKENRLALDTEFPDKENWETTLVLFNSFRRRKMINRMLLAASVFVFFALGVVTFFHLSMNPNQLQTESIFASVENNLVQQEMDYIHQINLVSNAVNEQKIPKEYKKMFNEFTQQLQIIDQQYEQCKVEIEKNGYNNELIQQVIYIYQLKLSVLKMFQAEVNKINELSKNKKHEYTKIKLSI